VDLELFFPTGVGVVIDENADEKHERDLPLDMPMMGRGDGQGRLAMYITQKGMNSPLETREGEAYV